MLGYKQKRAIDFLQICGKSTYFDYSTAENRRIVDSLEKRGIVDVWRDPPDVVGRRSALVSLRPMGPHASPPDVTKC
jgi:DNA-binding MarR family transcriptional regulator